MSWSVIATGTAEQVAEQIRRHEHHHWQNMPETERLMAHHVCGHLLKTAQAEEDANATGGPFLLEAGGYVSGGGYHEVSGKIRRLWMPPPIPEQPPSDPDAGPTTTE